MSTPSFQVEDLLAHQGFLRALARELVQDDARAEDVVQDAYVAAMERPPRSGAALRSWLATVVRNAAFNTLRGDGRRGARERAAARPEALPSHEDVSDRLEVSRRLIESVQTLAEPYRATLYLRFCEGLGLGEIARRQEASTDTVKTRLRRGVAQLRARMDVDRERSLWMASLWPLAEGRGSVLTGGVSKATTLAGGILGMKKLAWMAATLLVVLGGWRLLRRPGPAPAPRLAVASAQSVTLGNGVPVDEAPAAPPGERAAVVPGEPRDGTANPGQLRVRVLWEDGRSPAENVELLLMSGSHEGRDTRRGISDEDGRVLFADVQAGSAMLQAFRGGFDRVHLPVAEDELEYVVPRGFDLTGRVVDPRGRAVSGAEIWLSRRPSGWLGARVVARTGADGRFFVRSVQGDRAISARAPRFGSSLREPLDTRRTLAGEPLELVLELRGEGGAVEGQVVDPEGHPVPGAYVAVGDESGHAQRASGNWVPLAPPAWMRTDAEGRFRTEGVDVDDWSEVHVLAAGFPAQYRHVPVRAGETAHIKVTLSRGGVVAGTVRDGEGRPLSGVVVEVADWDGWGRFFPLPSTVSDADGTYRLEAVPVGELTLAARSFERLDLSQTRAELRVEPGDQGWDPVLWKAFEISGRLLDEGGAPVHGRSLTLTAASEEQAELSQPTGVNGEFRFHAKPGTYALSTLAPSAEGTRILLEGVEAGTTGLLLTLETGRSEGAFLTGSVEDAAGRFGDQERVQIQLKTPHRLIASTELVNGAFEFGPLAAGYYHVAVRSGDRVVLSTREIRLERGQRLDVGTLVTEDTGSVRVRFTADEGLDLDSLMILATSHERGYHHPLVLEGDCYVGAGLSPGAYDVLVLGEAAQASVPFEVRAGEEAATTVRLRLGALRTFEISLPEEAPPWRIVTLRVTDDLGNEVYRHSGPPMDNVVDTLPFAFAFPLGRHELHVELDNGLAVTHALEIGDLEPDHDPIRLRLD